MSSSSEKTPGQSGNNVVGWKEARVFVSSTFDDMHAERDYLVKEAFPRLREWCEKRRLRLVDVDLRWGVTEADATSNKRVVDVCLRRIDDCRPFFICLLGQRYGWIPRREDVADGTVGAYPHVAGALGAASVTEMEIMHATVEGKHAQDAFFYLRQPAYLTELPADPAQLRQRVYTDESEADGAARREKLRVLREQKIPATGRPVRRYFARWDGELRTPEIALAPECPATLPGNIEAWRKNWQRWGKVKVVGTDVNEDAGEGAKAAEHNAKLTRGRLVDFAVRKRSLGAWILRDLRQAIAARFPDHMVASEPSDLQRELDLQEELIDAARKGFIGRAADLAALDEYAEGDDARLFAVAAAGGIGKTTLLAKWISDRRKLGDTVFCRFVGVGDRSSSVDSLLASLMDELQAAGRITSEIPTDPKKLREKLPDLLAECASHGRMTIVIDALNQLDSALADLDWLPKKLPPALKLIVSFKTGTPAAAELLAQWQGRDVRVHVCHGFDKIDDRKALVTGYLERHLKELDQSHLASLVTVPGAENPLYLRVVLGELRVFGAFGQLREKLARDFGTTPIEAFAGVLRRLETDPAHAAIPPSTSVPLIFGLLAHSHGGLPEAAIVDLLETEANLGPNRRRDVAASVSLVLRQLRPYLAHREGRIDFFFESFQLAAKQRYTRSEMRSESAWNDALANWCAKWEHLESLSQRYALRWLPTHLMDAGRAADAAEVMTDFGYHHARVGKLGAADVVEVTKDFEALVNAELPAGPRERVETWQRFHNEIAHLMRRPGIRSEVELLQRAVVQADDSPVTQSAEAWLDSNGVQHWWFRKLGRPRGIAHINCVRTLEWQPEGWGQASLIALCADGRRIVLLDNRVLRVWDTETGTCIRTLRNVDLAIDPRFEPVVLDVRGQCMVTRSTDARALVWDLESGECTKALVGHGNIVSCVSLHSDGRRVVTGSHDNSIRVWDWRTGEELGTLVGHTSLVTSLALHVDGKRMLSGSYDNTARIWNIDTGECQRTLGGHLKPVRTVAIDRSGRSCVSGDNDGTLRLWDIESGECRGILDGCTDAKSRPAIATSMAFQVDGKGVLVARQDKTVWLWNLQSGSCSKLFDGGHGTSSVTLIPNDPKVIAVLDEAVDSAVQIWDVSTRNGEMLEMNTTDCHTSPVALVALQANGQRVLTAGAARSAKGNEIKVTSDNCLRLWDVETGGCLRTLEGQDTLVGAISLAANSDRAVTASADGKVRVWSLENGRCIQELVVGTNGLNILELHKDGRRVVIGSLDRTLQLWDLEAGVCLKGIRHHSFFRCVVLPQEGQEAVAVCDDGSGRDRHMVVWNLETGGIRLLPESPASIMSIAWHIDRTLVITGCSDRMVRVWNVETGVCVRTLAVSGGVNSIIVNPDGRRVVCNRPAGSLILDLETGKQLWEFGPPERGSRNGVAACVLHPDGRGIVTANGDHTLRLWDIEACESLGVWGGLSAFSSLDISEALPNRRARIVAGCADGSVHFFELMPPGPFVRST